MCHAAKRLQWMPTENKMATCDIEDFFLQMSFVFTSHTLIELFDFKVKTQNFVHQVDGFAGGSAIRWAGINHAGKMNIVHIGRCIDVSQVQGRDLSCSLTSYHTEKPAMDFSRMPE